MRSVIVALLAVMPTVGRRPRRIRSGSIASIWLSPAPKQWISRRRITRRLPPMKPAIVAADRIVPHFDHFGRHARQTNHAAGRSPFAGNLQIDARRGAVRISHHAAAGGKHRLKLVRRGHRPVAAGEHRADVLQGVGVELQRAAGRLGQRLARQIVGRGAKSAGGHDHVGPGDRLAKHLDAGRQFVADRGMIEHANAQLFEPLAEPLGVRVESLAAGDFVADGDDFGVHGKRFAVSRQKGSNDNPRGNTRKRER